jgi:hypothetical protein
MAETVDSFLAPFISASFATTFENQVSLLKDQVYQGKNIDILEAENFRALRYLYELSKKEFEFEKSKVFVIGKILDSLGLISSRVGLIEAWRYMTDKEVEDEIKKEKNVARCINDLQATLKSFTLHSAFEGILEKANQIKRLDKVQIKYPEDWSDNGKIFKIILADQFGNSDTTKWNLEMFNKIRSLFKLDTQDTKKKIEIPPSIPLETQPIVKEVRLEVLGKPFLSYNVLPDGGFEGEYLEYWPGTDKLRYKGTYKNNKEHGTFSQWNQDGILQYKVDFKEGKKHGNFFSFNNDKLEEFHQYKDNVLHGIYRNYTDEEWSDTTYFEGKEQSRPMEDLVE